MQIVTKDMNQKWNNVSMHLKWIKVKLCFHKIIFKKFIKDNIFVGNITKR